MSTDRMPRQSVPVRPVHFETPNSYLKRLCEANSVDRSWMETVVKQRRIAGGHGARELGLVINELGGPDPAAFESVHERARVGYPTTRGAWDKQRSTRTACLSCTAGIRASTYPHVRFAFCKRHGQWLGNTQRQGVLDAELWKAERLLRRLVTAGRVDAELYEGTWDVVRDHAYMVGGASQPATLHRALNRPEFTIGVDDRIALFPRTVQCLDAVTRPATVEVASPQARNNRAVLTMLTDNLQSIGGDLCLLVNGLQRLLVHRAERADLVSQQTSDAV